jgi:hypothetical protein
VPLPSSATPSEHFDVLGVRLLLVLRIVGYPKNGGDGCFTPDDHRQFLTTWEGRWRSGYRALFQKCDERRTHFGRHRSRMAVIPRDRKSVV